MAVDYEKEGRIAIFTINRPEAMNSLNSDVRREMHEAMLDFRDDHELWVGIITGAGEKAFCAGADIKEFRPGALVEKGITPIRADQIWKPFIAAINGYALGGGLELAMTCDIRIAADHARLGQPEVNIGFMPGAGGTQRLTRFIPRAKAAEAKAAEPAVEKAPPAKAKAKATEPAVEKAPPAKPPARRKKKEEKDAAA